MAREPEKFSRTIEDIDPDVADYDIVDVDVHSVDVLESLSDYVPDDSPWKRRFKRGDSRTDAAATFWPKSVGSRSRFDKIKRDHSKGEWDRDTVSTVMDFLSLDGMILLGQQMLTYGMIDWDDARMYEYSRAYTEYMLDNLVDPDKGIYTLIPAPYPDPERAADLIDDYADEEGVLGTTLVTSGAEPPLGNQKYDPIYETTEKNDLPLIYHSGGSGLDEFEIKGYGKFIETHTLGFMNANLSQITSITVQGVPERFPDMDIAFMESGVAYVPALMYRLDAEYMKRQDEAPFLEKRPSEYMKNYYYGTQPLEEPRDMEHLKQLMEMMGGPDNLIYASDYPHWDFDPPTSITNIPFLSEEQKQMVLADNAREVLQI